MMQCPVEVSRSCVVCWMWLVWCWVVCGGALSLCAELGGIICCFMPCGGVSLVCCGISWYVVCSLPLCLVVVMCSCKIVLRPHVMCVRCTVTITSPASGEWKWAIGVTLKNHYYIHQTTQVSHRYLVPVSFELGVAGPLGVTMQGHPTPHLLLLLPSPPLPTQTEVHDDVWSRGPWRYIIGTSPLTSRLYSPSTLLSPSLFSSVSFLFFSLFPSLFFPSHISSRLF